MTSPYDVIVAGLGAMGSAAVYHLARRGARVLGIDRFTPPHGLGSSHGDSRIIREAYFEHPLYVPLVQRAYTLWAELEEASGEPLLLTTGGLMIGPPDGMVMGGARRSAEQHGLRHEILSAAAVRKQFPALRPGEEMAAVWEPRAGILFPEQCIAAHLERARRSGAELRYGEAVASWRADGQGVEVTTAAARHRAGFLIVSAGAWVPALLRDLGLPLSVERQVLYWFSPRARQADFTPRRLPIYAVEYEPDRMIYGFADLGRGVKVARHHEGEATTPDELRRDIGPGEVAAMRVLLERFLPRANGALQRAEVCMYTNTPDGHFLIDRHPDHPQVLVVSPCSGHGFKFAAAIGEVVADLAQGTESRFDLSPFRLGRFAAD